MKNVITVTFDHYSLFQQRYARIIRRCIETALEDSGSQQGHPESG